ncbi:DUF1636 domain-containing protein [Pseudooceanicola sp. CBS1P-1]|uniref:DUF1636 domain-containing protein n=1 Tax=Pseudooceanicola albus TaxID=2692189 RepID=A0A6L7G6Z0_9RHOB|nr:MULTISPECIES: DUF1636 family protein [Pseudooceanicola]MBT9384732.1 DUF1636 domain-containing protein [Pseudooceanicola endophyticus]MXN18433.1 DUF1636 domain-containing protein [Pseudooceanicola albus]
MSTWITICDTCKTESWDAASGRTDGEALAALIEPAAAARGVKTRRVSCLMGCKQGCNVAIQGADKLNYTLGRFEPTAEAAEAIADYAALHQESATGQVPFRQWPQGVKGHFVTRHPPLPSEDA